MPPRGRRVRAQQPSKASAASLDALSSAVALSLLAALPAFVNLNSEQVFEEQKSLLLVAGAVLALPGLVWSRARHWSLVRDGLVLAVLAFVVLLFAASIGHDFPRAFWGAYHRRHGLLMWSALVVLFIAMCDVARTETGRRRLILAIVIGAAWPSIYLLLQRLGSDPVLWVVPNDQVAMGSTFGNQVFLGGYLAIAIPLTAIWAVQGRWWFISLLLIESTAIVASGSRGAVIAFAASLVVFVVAIGLRSVPRRTVGYAVAVVAVPLVLLIAVPTLRPDLSAERFSVTSGTARIRVVIWSSVISLLRDSGARLVIGHGPESLERLIPPYYSAELSNIEGSDAMPDRAHNEFLDTIVNAGIVGLILQLTLLSLACWRAAQIADPWWRAAVLSALVAHTVEIQFGFGTVASRLALLAIVAILVGLKHEAPAGRPQPLDGHWLILPAAVAAISWWISTWPVRALSLPATGTADDFIAYLDDLALGSTTLYVAMLLCVLVIAWRLFRDAAAHRPWPAVFALVIGMIIVIPLSLQPTWADGLTAAGAAFENKNQIAEAIVAYREAAKRAPHWSMYRANLGRVLVVTAVQRPAAERKALLDEAEAHYRVALANEPFDPDHYRHLAALLRVRAMEADETVRTSALNEADHLYADITARVSTIPSLWVEWGYLELDRNRRASAREKLDRAVALGGNTMTKVKMGELEQLIGQ